jgi:signal transduction histidine kinase
MRNGKIRLPPLIRSLSARLLVLTVLFVMLIEVFVYAPSIALYRKNYLEDRIAGGHLAALALEAAPDNMVGKKLERELLDHARAYVVVSKAPGQPKRMLMRETPPEVTKMVDLRHSSFMGLIMDAFDTLLVGGKRVLRVVGDSPKDPKVMIEVVLDEAPLRAEMIGYSKRILGLSLIISLFTAVLVFAALQWLMVRPMRRLTANMTEFSAAPEDEAHMIVPSGRSDEIGVAERQLRAMQQGLRESLRNRARLAALGSVVTKINHDLRNILTSASLVSDRLAEIADPKVRRVAPVLMRAIDRAISLCENTLEYARSDAIEAKKTSVCLRNVVEEVRAALPVAGNGGAPEFANEVDAKIEVLADRNQLFRALNNLGSNSLQAGAHKLSVSAHLENGLITIDVADDGPGLPKAAREHLFEPFAGSARAGGTGLGLAIARELAQAHGGDLKLLSSSQTGTVFRIELPAQ